MRWDGMGGFVSNFSCSKVFFFVLVSAGIYFGMVDCVHWKLSSPETGSCLISTMLPLSIQYHLVPNPFALQEI